MWKEFKDFIFTGNVIDFAIAVILAGAVGLVVNGFVNDIVMPVVGHFAGGTDFANLFHAMDGGEYKTIAEATDAGASVIAYGRWFNTIINLLIVGWVLFMLGKAKIKALGAAPDPGPTADQALLTEIRDAVKK